MIARRYREENLESHIRPLTAAADPWEFIYVDDNARPHRSGRIDEYTRGFQINAPHVAKP